MFAVDNVINVDKDGSVSGGLHDDVGCVFGIGVCVLSLDRLLLMLMLLYAMLILMLPVLFFLFLQVHCSTFVSVIRGGHLLVVCCLSAWRYCL